MIKLKFRKIKNESMVKDLFASLSEIIKEDLVNGDINFPPLHEVYNLMIENVKRNSGFQFCCEYSKITLGFVISSVSQIDPEMLFIPVLCVNNKYRNNGIANELLKEVEGLAKQNGLKKIRMSYSPSGKHFCQKNGYKLRLEICVPENIGESENNIIQNLQAEYISSKKYNNKIYLVFSLDKDNPSLLSKLSKSIKGATANFVFEKEI